MDQISEFYGKPTKIVTAKIIGLYLILIFSLLLAWLLYEEPPELTKTKPINWIVAITTTFSKKKNIQYSFDGFNFFESQGNDISNAFKGAYGLDKTGENFIWLVGGQGVSGSNKSIIYSYNGSVWIDGDANLSYVQNIGFGYDQNNNPRWVGVGFSRDNQPSNIIYSDNGISWSFSNGISFNNAGTGIDYGKDSNGDNLWVAAGVGNGNDCILYSYDDMNWKVSDGVSFGKIPIIGGIQAGYSVVFGTSEDINTKRWVAGGTTNNIHTMLYSDNGISWNNCTGVSFNQLSCSGIAFGKDNQNNPRWVAVGNDSRDNGSILYSDNGISWNFTTGEFFFLEGIDVGFGKNTNGNPLWTAIGTKNSINAESILLHSFDGIDWFKADDSVFFGEGGGGGVISNVLSQGVQSIF